MYSLRSKSSRQKQATIDFASRKRTRTFESSKSQLEAVDLNAASSCSPPKKSKGDMPVSTRSGGRKQRPPQTITPKASARTLSQRARPQRHHTTPSPPPPPSVESDASFKENIPITTPERRQKESCDHTTSPPRPGNTPGRTPGRVVMQRLENSELAALQAVKKSLHNSLPSTLLCRESELAAMTDFIRSHIKEKQSGALYVSGAPGTGKTACLSHILGNCPDITRAVSVVIVNCMSVKQPQAIFSRIAEGLGCQPAAAGGGGGRGVQARLEKHITSAKKMIMVVLDEIDQLDSRGQEILYSIFEWPALRNSRLLLLGIANALDLTDRILPRLQSHSKCRPTLLHFPPYTRQQISTILTARLAAGREEEEEEEGKRPAVVDAMAVQFCARKVAAVHGDLRKALDICRRAVEMVETQERCQRLKLAASTHSSSPRKHKPIRVTLAHIATVISEVYASSLTSQATQQTFPLQQKLAICSLLLLVKGRSIKEVTLGRLYDAYTRVCRHRQLKSEGESEFVGVCAMLESRGLVGVKKAKEARLAKVALKLEEGELEHALQDKVLISSVLEHGLPSC